MTFQASVRAAAVSMLRAYAASTTPALKLQVYEGRPRSIKPPTAFVDSIRERFPTDGSMLIRREPTVDIVVLFGSFDSKDAVDQKDAFVDGFLAWTLADIHSAGANTTFAITETEDLPTFVNDWMPTVEQTTYYAVRIALEGLALSG